MGSKLSIDKHVSSIEDILEMSPTYFSKLKIENNIPDSITQHLKIWRYYEEEGKPKSVKSAPMSLKDILDSNFTFSSNECYLVLFVYKKQVEGNYFPQTYIIPTSETVSSINFPQSMWGVVESYSNLTPRGLEAPVTSSESISNLNKEVLGSFLMPKRINNSEEGKLEYMVFVWNGKTASSLMKAITLSAALEFDTLISKSKDPFLQVLFSGGYIRNKKLWIGKILQIDSSVLKEANPEFERRIDPAKDAVYLLKFLFPNIDGRSFKAKGFRNKFLNSKLQSKMEDEYVVIGGSVEEDQKDFTTEMSPMNSPISYEKTESEYIDEISLENSYRNHEDFHPGGRMTFPMTNNLTYSDTFTQRGPEHDSKIKKFIPNLKLNNLGNEQPKKEIKVDSQPLSEDKPNGQESFGDDKAQEPSVEDISNNQENKQKSDKKVPAKGQPINLDVIAHKKGPNEEGKKLNNIESLHFTKESEIKRYKKELYLDQCNAVVEDFLFVAGEVVAYNSKKLADFGITHILNAAGDACENKFPENIKYLTFYIKDSRTENIECVFYEAINFIESARQQGGKVLVHCVQGISRSVTLCMAYIILSREYTFLKAYEHIRSVREIASPNPAFWAQLYNFQLRLYGPFESIPSPRSFCIGSYQKETPQTIVARLLFETTSLFNSKSYKTLDPRTVFIINSKERVYIWIGNEILPANKDRYIAKAEDYVKVLQKYEHASQEVITVLCGEEPQEFWSLWTPEPKTKYGRNKEWDHWFVDLATHKNVQGTTIYEELEDEKPAKMYLRSGLYCYPELEPLRSVDMEELVEQNLLVLCTQKEEAKIAYVWRGQAVPPETSKVDEQAYLANVLRQRWPETDPSNVVICQEVPNDESVTFLDYFQGI